MSEIVYGENWLNEKQLKFGKVYLIKDGRLMLYLGRSIDGMQIFYVLASAYMQSIGYNKYTFGNYIHQVKGLTEIIIESLSSKGIASCILKYKGIPKIYGEFPINNLNKNYIKNWYITSFDKHTNVAELANISNSPVITGYVSSKDLIPGHLYYSGGCWRSTYIYLGRTSNKEYVWYFVSNGNSLLTMPLRSVLLNAHKTKQNKKVKPLEMAISDEKAYVCADTLKLIESHFTLDVTGLNTQLLDTCRD